MQAVGLGLLFQPIQTRPVKAKQKVLVHADFSSPASTMCLRKLRNPQRERTFQPIWARSMKSILFPVLYAITFLFSSVTAEDTAQNNVIFDAIIEAGKQGEDPAVIKTLDFMQEVSREIQTTRLEVGKKTTTDRRISEVEVDRTQTPAMFYFSSPDMKLEKLAEWDLMVIQLAKMPDVTPRWSAKPIDLCNPVYGSYGTVAELVLVSQIFGPNEFHAYSINLQNFIAADDRADVHNARNRLFTGAKLNLYETQMLELSGTCDSRLIVKGVSTSGLKEKMWVPLKSFSYVGTEQYETTRGSTTTVHTLNPVNRQEFERYLDSKIPIESRRWGKPEHTFRKWNASEGNFSVDAKLVGSTPSTATLQNSDGKKIDVPLSKLSKADQAWIKASVRVDKNIESIIAGTYKFTVPERTAR